MSDPKQQAEDHYYAALDLFADGKQNEAIAEYENVWNWILPTQKRCTV